MSTEKEKSSDLEMTFFEHLEALRPHLIRGVIALCVIMGVTFLGKHIIIDTILMGPSSADFVTNRWLCQLSRWLFGNESLCINQIRFNMVNTSMGGQFNLHMQVTFVSAIVLAIPYLLWEIWRFVLPALTPYERHRSHMFVLYVSLCFFTGLLFGYFLITPLSVNFLSTYQASSLIINMIDARSYLRIVLSVSLACAAVFQLPLLVYFLARMGLVTADFMKKYRKQAILILAIAAAIITPPDAFSMILVVLPIWGLYEYSIVLAAKVERKKAQEAKLNEVLCEE